MPTYRVREPFLWRGRVYAQGELVEAGDPVISRNLVLFDPPVIEQATAAPGERRSVRIPKKES